MIVIPQVSRLGDKVRCFAARIHPKEAKLPKEPPLLRAPAALRKSACICAMSLGLFTGFAQAGAWYVGNTSSGDSVKYKKSYFAAGTYRFTARAGAATSGKLIHLKVDGVALNAGVAVPNTGRADTFGYVHLGTRTLAAGTHDLEVVFNNGGASLDWFMAVKDSDTGTSVKASDTAMVPPPTDGLNFFPNFAYHSSVSNGHSSSMINMGYPVTDADGNPYTDEQIQAWFAIPMWRDYDRRTDRYWDQIVDTFVAMRTQSLNTWANPSTDATSDLQDREMGDFGFQPRYMKKFAEAIARNPQAANTVKTSIRWGVGELGNDFYRLYGYYPRFADASLVDYAMDYFISPFLDNIPISMLFQPAEDEFVLMMENFYPRGVIRDGKNALFFTNLKARIKEKYGLTPRIVCFAGSNAPADTKAAHIWGEVVGMGWDQPLLKSNFYDGTYFHNTSNGSRHGIKDVWLNNWDPVTNDGTGGGNSPRQASHQPRIDANGDSTWLTNLATAATLGGPYIEYEGVTNIAEGNSSLRSYHPEFVWPNQHIAAFRQFADPVTQTAMFEAEACDSYVKANPVGNAGGTYRREWYGPTNLDVYRPLHNIQAWKPADSGPGNLATVTAGLFDSWALDASGVLWGHRLAGNPDIWTKVHNPAPSPFSRISLGRGYAWGLTTAGAVHRARILTPGANYINTGWNLKSGTMAWLDAGDAEVWATDASGNVYRQSIDGTDAGWTSVPGQLLDKVWVGDAHVWGIRGTTLYHAFIPTPPATYPITFVAVPNPNNLTQLSVGADEVWGVNAAGNIYRMSASAAVGVWEAVPGPGAAVTSLDVGGNHVWCLAGATPYFCRVEGFKVNDPPMAPLGLRALARSGQASLSWVPVTGATSYTIQRSTSSGGTYATVGTSTTPAFVNTGLSNGTTYYYKVTATTPVGTSPASQVCKAAPAATTATPTGLTATAVSLGQIDLSWTDAGGSNTAGYIIERSYASNPRSFRTLARIIGPGTTAYSDTMLHAGTGYSYRIRAYNSNLVETSNSGFVNATTPGGSTLHINFQPHDDGVPTPTVPGYAVDFGQKYGAEQIVGNSLYGGPQQIGTKAMRYGWENDAKGQTRQRGVNPDLRLDTVLLWRKDETWSIDVPPGNYNVLLAIGDNQDTVSSTVSVNGVSYWTNQTLGPNQFVNLTRTVTAVDGKITLSQGGPNNSVRLNYVQITPTSSPAAAPGGLTGVSGNAQVALSWNAMAGATNYEIWRATSPNGPFALVASPLSTTTSFTDINLSNKAVTYYYKVSAIVGGMQTQLSNAVGTMPGTYQSPWTAQSIGGSTGDGGNQHWNSGETLFTLFSRGTDIHNTADQFRYVYQTATGDCSIVARVYGVENVDPWSKAGIMIRETLAAGSRNVAMVLSPSSGMRFQYRSITDGTTGTAGSSGAAPYWLKLTRVGNVFTGYSSPDGATWTQLGSPQTIVMGSTTYIGLALTSHDANMWGKATFDSVLAIP